MLYVLVKRSSYKWSKWRHWLVALVQESLPDEHDGDVDEGDDRHTHAPRHQHPEVGGGGPLGGGGGEAVGKEASSRAFL